MKLSPVLLLFSLYLFISSCNENSEKVSPPETIQQEDTDTLRSGIIHMKSVGMVGGSTMERTIYFEDNGLRRRIETIATTKEGDKDIITTHIKIIAGGYSTSFDPEEKLGTKTAIDKSGGSGELDFSTLNPKTLEEYGVHKEGTEVIAGKTCDIFTESNSSNNNYKKRSSIWNGFLLHEVTSNDHFKYEYIADKVVENVVIQPYMFIVPDSILVTDPNSFLDSIKSTSTYLDTLKQKNKLQGREIKK